MSISTEDHIEIQRLMYRYARCADTRDYGGFADVFCEDALFNFAGTVVTPCAAIQEMMHVLDKYACTLHQVHNTLYDVEGDIASGETYCIASHLLQSAGIDGLDGLDKKIEMGIIYQDSLQRTPAGWRIAQRNFKLLWTETTTIDALQVP